MEEQKLRQQIDELRRENEALRRINAQLQEVVQQFTDGMLAFEIHQGGVRPLYVSDNICHFFGYSRQEWLALTQESHPIADFVSKSGIPLETFFRLLQSGEAEFDYMDMAQSKLRRMKAICTPSLGDSPRYVMLYSVNGSSDFLNKKVEIRTFGYFDVFVDGKPIAFRNEKSKELFALLVDRKGGYVTSSEAIGYLWETEPVNQVTLARYRKVPLRLKNLLEEYGIAAIMESVDGKRRIVPQRVDCDLYQYLSGKEEYCQLFKGSYLLNYSWSEMTLSQLMEK